MITIKFKNQQIPHRQQQNVKDQQTPEEYYELEKLKAKKQINGKTYFKVKWVGYRETSWEPQEEIPPLPLQNYYKTHTKAGKRRKRFFFSNLPSFLALLHYNIYDLFILITSVIL